MEVADASKTIRNKLKMAGYTSKHVSVRSQSYSMGSSIKVEIKSAHVDPAIVLAASNCEEKISYCQSSGEILSGGNRFVNVEFDSKLVDVFGEEHEAGLTDAIARLKARNSQSALEPIEDTPFMVGHDRNCTSFTLWTEKSFSSYLFDVQQGARVIARTLLLSGAVAKKIASITARD